MRFQQGRAAEFKKGEFKKGEFKKGEIKLGDLPSIGNPLGL
jgi:hypothetical protein